MPADGRHLAFPDVDAAEGFYVKGAKFSLGRKYWAVWNSARNLREARW